jgi:protein-tyrosine phosphatase
MKNILVLCVGNICRSPMAEALLTRALPGRHVHSAGVGALIGNEADPLSVQLMQDVGLDITRHRARQISSVLVAAADLILVMDLEQKRFVESRYVSARGKVFRLGESAKVDIPDPYRQGIESFREAYALINDGVVFWADQLERAR